MQKISAIFFLVVTCLFFSGCYHNKYSHGLVNNTVIIHEADTLSRHGVRHYGRNYNFVIKRDSLILLRQQPEESISNMHTDSIVLYKGNHLVVADFRIMPSDRVDSVWVQVARDQHTFGWVHQTLLLQSVVPDDPISQFISVFSDTHTLIFLFLISLIAISYMLHHIFKSGAKVVHFNDIDSVYPALLATIIAASATFYSSIQLFAADMWQQYYYHPSLNPFTLSPILALFVSSVWAMIVVSLAAVDDIFNKLPFGQALLYLGGLAGVCAANYIVFSISTIYYIGYPLLIAYICFAAYRYVKYNHFRYICGACGHRLSHKGRCPYCGAMND